MKLINELIEFALQHDMLTEEHKRMLQDDGFYTFYHAKDFYPDEEEEIRYRESIKQELDRRDDELDRRYNDEFYHPGKRYGRRHHGGGGKSRKNKKTELELSDLEVRVQAAFKRWDKSLNPLVQTVSFLANHGMNAQGRDLNTWQSASNWLFEVNGQKLFEAVANLDVTQMFKFTHLCSLLTWMKLRELLVEPIRQCKGECVTTFKELIRGTNEALSESAENMLQNEHFAQVYRLAEGWSKIC